MDEVRDYYVKQAERANLSNALDEFVASTSSLRKNGIFGLSIGFAGNEIHIKSLSTMELQGKVLSAIHGVMKEHSDNIKKELRESMPKDN